MKLNRGLYFTGMADAKAFAPDFYLLLGPRCCARETFAIARREEVEQAVGLVNRLLFVNSKCHGMVFGLDCMSPIVLGDGPFRLNCPDGYWVENGPLYDSVLHAELLRSMTNAHSGTV